MEKAAKEKAQKAQQKSERKKERQLAATGAVKTKRKGLKLKKGFRVKVPTGPLMQIPTWCMWQMYTSVQDREKRIHWYWVCRLITSCFACGCTVSAIFYAAMFRGSLL